MKQLSVRAHVQRIKAAIELVELPPKPHEGSCGPWSQCDGDCVSLANISQTISDALKSLNELRKIAVFRRAAMRGARKSGGGCGSVNQ